MVKNAAGGAHTVRPVLKLLFDKSSSSLYNIFRQHSAGRKGVPRWLALPQKGGDTYNERRFPFSSVAHPQRLGCICNDQQEYRHHTYKK